jgi:hypothetical protein
MVPIGPSGFEEPGDSDDGSAHCVISLYCPDTDLILDGFKSRPFAVTRFTGAAVTGRAVGADAQL